METVLVTGASGNLGRAIVSRFLESNYQVVGIYHNTSPDLNRNVELFKINLIDEEETATKLQLILEKKSIDVAVLTAGGFSMNTIEKTSLKDIRQMISLNFETAYNIVRPLFTQMVARNKGKIFLIGSQQGAHPEKGKTAVAYTLSKSLLFTLAKILNAEASGKNVEVIVIIPTIIDTPQNREAMPNADTSEWMKPEEIAEGIYNTCKTTGS